MTQYPLNLHNSQGDDFNCFLEINSGDVNKSLRAWAKFMRANADKLDLLAAHSNKNKLEVVLVGGA